MKITSQFNNVSNYYVKKTNNHTNSIKSLSFGGPKSEVVKKTTDKAKQAVVKLTSSNMSSILPEIILASQEKNTALKGNDKSLNKMEIQKVDDESKDTFPKMVNKKSYKR